LLSPPRANTDMRIAQARSAGYPSLDVRTA
jgi:hypothetical protein